MTGDFPANSRPRVKRRVAVTRCRRAAGDPRSGPAAVRRNFPRNTGRGSRRHFRRRRRLPARCCRRHPASARNRLVTAHWAQRLGSLGEERLARISRLGGLWAGAAGRPTFRA